MCDLLHEGDAGLCPSGVGTETSPGLTVGGSALFYIPEGQLLTYESHFRRAIRRPTPAPAAG